MVESAGVIALAVIEAERLLIEVTEEMERFYTHIGSRDAPLEEAPEVLKAIGMHPAIDILDGVIHNLVRVVAGESAIGEKRIGVERGTRFHVLANLSAKFG